MGGYALGVTIEATSDSPLPPIELHKKLWFKSLWEMRSRVKRKAGQNVFLYYLRDQRVDGYDEGRWHATPTELNYSFHDPGGCCGMSSVASLHWFRMAFASLLEKHLDGIAADHGYRIVGPRLSAAEVFGQGARFPMIEIDKTLYCVAAGDDNPELFTDNAVLDFGALKEKDKARVQAILETGYCQCQYCERMSGLKSLAQARVPKPLT